MNDLSKKRPRLLPLQINGEVPDLPSSHSSNVNNENGEPLSDEMLKSWQNNLIATSIEDNTINLVLEQYLTFFESRSNPDPAMVEDQAVLMAINEHGLQNPINNLNHDRLQSDYDAIDDELPANYQSSSSSSSTVTVNITQGEANHTDFMEAAVAVAIQKKGLAPYSIQMSPTR